MSEVDVEALEGDIEVWALAFIGLHGRMPTGAELGEVLKELLPTHGYTPPG